MLKIHFLFITLRREFGSRREQLVKSADTDLRNLRFYVSETTRARFRLFSDQQELRSTLGRLFKRLREEMDFRLISNQKNLGLKASKQSGKVEFRSTTKRLLNPTISTSTSIDYFFRIGSESLSIRN